VGSDRQPPRAVSDVTRAFSQEVDTFTQILGDATIPVVSSISSEGLLKKLLVGNGRKIVVHDGSTSPDLTKLLALRQAHWAQEGICVVNRQELDMRLLNRYSSQGDSFRSSTWQSWTAQANALHSSRTGQASG
jgi:hypothetical protein